MFWIVGMRNFQDTFETRKRSSMTVPLNKFLTKVWKFNATRNSKLVKIVFYNEWNMVVNSKKKDH